MLNDVVFKGSWNELPFSGRLSRNCYQGDPQSFRQLANTSRKLTSTTTTLTSVVTVEAGRATRTTRMMKKEVTQEDLVYNALISRFQPKENKSILSLSLFPLLYIIKFSTPLGLSYVETTSSNLEKKYRLSLWKLCSSSVAEFNKRSGGFNCKVHHHIDKANCTAFRGI